MTSEFFLILVQASWSTQPRNVVFQVKKKFEIVATKQRGIVG